MTSSHHSLEVDTNDHVDFEDCKYLNLSNNPELGEYAIAKIAAKCISLQTLIVNNCLQLKESGLEQILRACKKLRVIHLNNSPQLKDKPYKALLKGYPSVEFKRDYKKYSNPKDSGLRVKLPHVNSKRPGAKKKKKN